MIGKMARNKVEPIQVIEVDTQETLDDSEHQEQVPADEETQGRPYFFLS